MERMLSPAQVADILGLSIYTVRDAIRTGELRAIKMRGRWRIEPSDVAAWKDSCAVDTIPAIIRDMPMPITRAKVPAGGFSELSNDIIRRRHAA